MRLEELKHDLPETPAFIHNMVQEAVARQTEATNIVPMKRISRHRWSIGRIAAAAIACAVVTSSVAYASVKLYHMYLEKQGAYSVQTGIMVDTEEPEITIPKQIHDIAITSEYIPDGMEWTDEGNKLNFIDTPYQGGISLSSVLYDKTDLSALMLDKNVVQSEERNFGDYDGVYLQYHGLKQSQPFDQRIYLLCPEQYRIITIYFGGVSKEDAFKFAEGIVITEKDALLDTNGLLRWRDQVNPEVETEGLSVTNANIPIHKIGDTFELKNYVFAEDVDGNFIDADSITVCVDSVQIADNLLLLDGENIPDEWKNAVDENGNLVQNHLSFIKAGDGVESLDQVVDEKTVNQKLVYITVTYTNTSGIDLKHILYLGTLMTLEKQNDGTYTVYMDGETPGNGFDYYTGDSVAQTAEMSFSSVTDAYGNGGNYIPSLSAGESIQIKMAWIVNEQDLENMYLNLNGSGSVYEFDDAIIETGLVNINE